MLTRLATVTFVAVMSLSPPTEQNPADELAALKREVQALKEQQVQIQRELQAIKVFLQTQFQPRQAQEPEVPGLIGALIPTEGEPSMGSPTAKVTVMEISDYHCPFCKRHIQQTFPQMSAEYIKTGKARYVFVDYPIAQLHPQAARSHEAAACAAEQGKFWEMHDMMFGEQQKLAVSDLKDKARRLGMDGKKFDSCLDNGRSVEQVQKDQAEGSRVGVTGTPAIFINGALVPGGAVPYATVAAAIDKELARTPPKSN
jgi:protein-disulfide isomerase